MENRVYFKRRGKQGVEIIAHTDSLFALSALMPNTREEPLCSMWPCVMTAGGQTG